MHGLAPRAAPNCAKPRLAGLSVALLLRQAKLQAQELLKTFRSIIKSGPEAATYTTHTPFCGMKVLTGCLGQHTWQDSSLAAALRTSCGFEFLPPPWANWAHSQRMEGRGVHTIDCMD